MKMFKYKFKIKVFSDSLLVSTTVSPSFLSGIRLDLNLERMKNINSHKTKILFSYNKWIKTLLIKNWLG